MRFALLLLLKITQILLIVILLWRVFSECTICGHFVSTKTVIRYEIDGTCQKLFFYLPPNPEEKRMNILSNISPNLRLWWSFDGEKFMPPKPEKEQLQKIAEKIKEEIYSSARLLEIELKKENKKEEKLKEGIRREKRRLPWLEMQKNAILPDEERRYFSDLNRNVQDNDELNVLDNETKQKQHLEEKEILCYKINLQEELINNLENHKFGQASPLINLANRSVATIAVGFAHLLLLFSQVYLLNCLEVDNLEQRRGKLFLEILIILIGALGWLIVFLFKVRTELNWEAAWRCTNFRPLLLEMLIMTQVDNFDLKYKFSFQRFLLEFF